MIRHPHPKTLAAQLRQAADVLDDSGPKAIERAKLLASRGFPASVSGNGSRSADQTSSTERAALNPHPWVDIDDTLAKELRAVWKAVLDLEGTVSRVMSHASDDDPIPAGTGHCLRCDKFCRPDDKKPHNRLMAGLCGTRCYQAWVRAGRPERTGFIRHYEPTENE